MKNNLIYTSLVILFCTSSIYSQNGIKTRGGTFENTEDNIQKLTDYTYHALIIGVQHYNDKQMSLTYPIADADSLIKLLESNYSFNAENIMYLKDPTRRDIIDSFEKLTGLISELDHLLIFYAGHGFYDENLRRGYWLPADADKNDKSSWVSNNDVKDYIAAIKSKHTLLITDACFSGSILEETRGIAQNQKIQKLLDKKARIAMTSGLRETVPDKSVFLEYLIKGLRDNNDPYITATALFVNSIREPVMENTENLPQCTPIKDAKHEGGDFIFLKSRRNDTMKDENIIQLHVLPESAIITVDGIEVGKGNCTIRVPRNKCVEILIQSAGYATVQKSICYKSDGNTVQSFFMKMDDDQAFVLTEEDSLLNSLFSVKEDTSHSESENWRYLVGRIVTFFNEIALSNYETKDLRTTWASRIYNIDSPFPKIIRTRLVISDGGYYRYNVKIENEISKIGKECNAQDNKPPPVNEDKCFVPFSRIDLQYKFILDYFKNWKSEK